MLSNSDSVLTVVSVELTHEEHQMLLFVLRQHIRKQDRNRASIIRKFGEDADFTEVDRRVDVLESLYRKFGKDPENITYEEPDDGEGRIG